MDLPRPQLVRQLDLTLSAEGRGFCYLLHDRATGQILRLSRGTAAAWHRFAGAVSRPDARAGLAEEDARAGFSALAYVRQMRDNQRFVKKRFNPVQMQFRLIEDLSVVQPALVPVARHAFGPRWVAAIGVLLTLAVLLGLRNDWALIRQSHDVFSLEALLTFGLVAPFLKVIHEFGHVLAATRFKVRLRGAGVNLIGLYPIPFVDCSEADLSATRWQRILISAAGILTDIALGLVLFIAWHLVSNPEAQLVIGRAFLFSVFNSLVFNANPLMRMDGYFILSDLLSRRNLATDASAALRRVRGRVFGDGVRTQKGDGPLAGFALASAAYRWVVIFGIVWAILPRFLGLGLVLGLWGAVVILLAPMQAAFRKAPETRDVPAPRGGLMRWRVPAMLGGLILVLLFVPVAPRQVIDVTADTVGAYAIAVSRPGRVVVPPPTEATLATGAAIVTLANPTFDAALVQAELRVAEADLAAQVATGAGAAGVQRGADQRAAAEAGRAIARADIAALSLTAPEAGRFIAARPIAPGDWLAPGTVVGSFLPEDGETVLTGAFPETHVEDWDRGLRRVSLRSDGMMSEIDPARVRLVEEVKPGTATTKRSLTLRLAVPVAPATIATSGQQVRLSFTPIPVWRHVAGWGRGKIAQFRDAEIAERQRRLEDNQG
ncbi:M50 family metallopeptidase [Maritimibacter sp. DP1N21-5]|uniref:M50 family metallopeptidase n=1 Tax=Maritimibacter sp. DP1N21-5 TaxID=2836867 RepID=UPI001C453C24|nr:M50 family metallopeptidase [Maritimibacter sp. DP1N21-5]MBV7407466.1 M50 family metallopeptidase [Maritimibacter sp. DP1N21-5]